MFEDINTISKNYQLHFFKATFNCHLSWEVGSDSSAIQHFALVKGAWHDQQHHPPIFFKHAVIFVPNV